MHLSTKDRERRFAEISVGQMRYYKVLLDALQVVFTSGGQFENQEAQWTRIQQVVKLILCIKYFERISYFNWHWSKNSLTTSSKSPRKQDWLRSLNIISTELYGHLQDISECYSWHLAISLLTQDFLWNDKRTIILRIKDCFHSCGQKWMSFLFRIR